MPVDVELSIRAAVQDPCAVSLLACKKEMPNASAAADGSRIAVRIETAPIPLGTRPDGFWDDGPRGCGGLLA